MSFSIKKYRFWGLLLVIAVFMGVFSACEKRKIKKYPDRIVGAWTQGQLWTHGQFYFQPNNTWYYEYYEIHHPDLSTTENKILCFEYEYCKRCQKGGSQYNEQDFKYRFQEDTLILTGLGYDETGDTLPKILNFKIKVKIKNKLFRKGSHNKLIMSPINKNAKELIGDSTVTFKKIVDDEDC